MLRVAIDTNILLSGVFFDNRPEKLLTLGINGDIDLILPNRVISEAKEKIAEKEAFSRKLSQTVVDFLDVITRACGEQPSDIRDPAAGGLSCRDAEDTVILNQVSKLKPDYFISGDKDILAVTGAEFYICTLTDFLGKNFPTLL